MPIIPHVGFRFGRGNTCGFIKGNTRKRITPKWTKGRGCWICTSHKGMTNGGYPVLSRNGIPKKIAIWRWEQSHPGKKHPPDKECCHHCNNPKCVRWGPLHCYWGSRLQNMREMSKSGRGKNQFSN